MKRNSKIQQNKEIKINEIMARADGMINEMNEKEQGKIKELRDGLKDELTSGDQEQIEYIARHLTNQMNYYDLRNYQQHKDAEAVTKEIWEKGTRAEAIIKEKIGYFKEIRGENGRPCGVCNSDGNAAEARSDWSHRPEIIRLIDETEQDNDAITEALDDEAAA